ncbi:MAG: hypothetical protein A2341_07970 [Deltaproteobacteria bacterium RIFOXYB12_FULL_58_9]|nr:MAG: hypothetical protein A2341_07970 [Deltaproteobacteria bacterium RIFOXYB12_FULL_58_9]
MGLLLLDWEAVVSLAECPTWCPNGLLDQKHLTKFSQLDTGASQELACVGYQFCRLNKYMETKSLRARVVKGRWQRDRLEGTQSIVGKKDQTVPSRICTKTAAWQHTKSNRCCGGFSTN